jgi:hypothetical protein
MSGVPGPRFSVWSQNMLPNHLLKQRARHDLPHARNARERHEELLPIVTET